MSVKNIVLLFWGLTYLSFPATGHAIPTTRPTVPTATGAWSQIVDGVQGRLLVAPGYKINGTMLPQIYLELRNVSDLANPLDVYYGKGEGVRLEVIDSQNKKVAADTFSDFDQMMPEPYGIVLPHDSSMRFLVSCSGHGVSRNAGILLEIGTGLDGAVLLPNNSHQFYFLQGTFSSRAVKKASDLVEWQGTLILPKVDLSPLFTKP